MRDSCLDCARKHLAQALVLLGEAHQGYPAHHWLAIGHLAEAADELVAKWPAMANTIRAHRKKLEGQRTYQVPVMDLIDQVSRLALPAAPSPPPPPRQSSGVTMATEGVDRALGVHPTTPLPANVAPCTPCEAQRFATAQVARYMAEQQEIGEGKPFKGRLIIIATLLNFDRSYSLTSVILDQAKAAVLAGLVVDLWVTKGCSLEALPVLPRGVTIVPMLPPVRHEEDAWTDPPELVEDAIAKLLLPLAAVHGSAPINVIAHDLLLQSWFVTEAKAVHRLAERSDMPTVRWWHQVHSSVNNRLGMADIDGNPQWFRSHLPKGHRLLSVNASDVNQLAHYYHTTVDRIDILPNGRDPLTTLGLTAEAATIATACDLLAAEVVQIMPISADRLILKGATELVRLFAALARHGTEVRLVFALSNAVGEKAEQQIAAVKQAAKDASLPERSFAFSSELVPATARRGLSQDAIRGLFAVSNLFAFPTVSEAASLVVWEAMLAGCLMVMNDSLPCLKEQVPAELGEWVAWPSQKSPGTPSPTNETLDLVAGRILDQLTQRAYQSKRHGLMAASLGRYAFDLQGVLRSAPG